MCFVLDKFGRQFHLAGKFPQLVRELDFLFDKFIISPGGGVNARKPIH